MIPFIQTQVHDPENGVIGNCFRTCLASILERAPNSIPTFEILMGSKFVWLAITSWLNQQGLEPELVTERPNGYSIAMVTTQLKDGDINCHHCCVAKDGEVVFNPQVSPDGLDRFPSDYTRDVIRYFIVKPVK